MNKNAFDVFLQKQRDNEEINEIAALGRLAAPAIRAMAKTKPKPRVVGKPAVTRPGSAGASEGGLTRALMKRRERASTPEFRQKYKDLSAKAKSAPDPKAAGAEFKGNIDKLKGVLSDPAKMKTPEGQLRRDRLALAQKLRDRGGKASTGMKLKAGLGKVGRAIDTPQNRELAKRAVKGVAAFAKRGGFSSGFNQLYKDDIPTGYRSAGGPITPGRVIGVGTQAGDEAAIDRARAERSGPAGSGSPSRDPFAGLSPIERRKARTYGAATGT